ncbi:hypothetical protein [Pseudomonas sp. HY7a-MNA-CIBAN-0227]|uniref:hypothetical protein n=1 Tax=Pseudomonas sp. HY7a-MNA-CIBAN-0227 TaxID=3140474 RepID=UPI003334A6E6
MKSKSLADLPEVFLPFETIKIEGSSVIFFNEDFNSLITEADLLHNYSYVVTCISLDNISSRDRKLFFAERYGGDGILTNGGGGRCGFDGKFQVKGIGPNKLVGKGVEESHANGFLSLNLAIYEAVWSEIIHFSLPYGAVRAVAILDTDTDFIEQQETKPRSLLIREPSVRPAHFIRATFFKEDHHLKLSEDARRVASAISRLDEFLPKTSRNGAVCFQGDPLEDGLVELAKRFASQFAAARAKGIAHSNVSASNVAMNGAWLDLSRTMMFTLLIADDLADIKKFNQEYVNAIESIRSICFFLGKYLLVDKQRIDQLFLKVVEEFAKTYERQLHFYNAIQAGFPRFLLTELIESSAFKEFSIDLQKTLELDEFSIQYLAKRLGWDGYEHWRGRLYLALHKNIACHFAMGDFEKLGVATDLAKKLTSSFNNLTSLVMTKGESKGFSRKNIGLYLIINATRLNRTHSLLMHLETAINEAVIVGKIGEKPNNHQALIEEAVMVATLTLDDGDATNIAFWLSTSIRIWFSATSGLFFIDGVTCQTVSFEELIEMRDSNSEINSALSFYGKILEAVL